MSPLKRIKAVLRRFYYEHHDAVLMEADLAKEVSQARVRALVETKQQVLAALDFRLEGFAVSLTSLRERNGHEGVIRDLEARQDEVETIRHYIKGMVIKVEE